MINPSIIINMSEQVMLLIVGAALTFLFAANLAQWSWIRKAITGLTVELATLKALWSLYGQDAHERIRDRIGALENSIALVDRDEIARQRHRLNDAEIHLERLDGAVAAIQERCQHFHPRGGG